MYANRTQYFEHLVTGLDRTNIYKGLPFSLFWRCRIQACTMLPLLSDF